MKRLIFITTILILQSFPSFGKWIEFERGSTYTKYYEEDTLTRRDDLVYVNELIDLVRPNLDFGNLSSISRSVINCKKLTVKSIQVIRYKRSMGKGKIVYEFNFPPSVKPLDLLRFPSVRTLREILCK